MRCPACQTTHLEIHQPPSAPRMLRCPSCRGQWVQSLHYWRWREANPNAPRLEAAEDAQPQMDTPAGKLCPECGRFLIRRKVGHGFAFHLERCGGCGGVWLDALEWEALAKQGLHRDLHFIFTEAWQARVRETQAREADQRRLATTVGDADAARIREICDWLSDHPHRRELLAYLRHMLEA